MIETARHGQRHQRIAPILLGAMACLAVSIATLDADAQTPSPGAQGDPLPGLMQRLQSQAKTTVSFADTSKATPAGLIASAPMLVIGRLTLAAKDASELLGWIKQTGAAVRVGHDGGWSASHACALQLQQVIGTKLTLIAASAPKSSVEHLKAGDTDLVCVAAPDVLGEVQSGTVTPYVLASGEHLAALWDVPTADEAGLPLFSATTWLGLYVPDAATASAANTALQSALADDAMAQTLADAGWTPFPLTHRTPAAHDAFRISETERMTALFSAAGIAPPAAK